ncbi:MAG TPA: hypothetical protein ENI49_01135, partial [Thermoplasmatales archaeon]|nr:hypothetical protein [Thermoplasmatales archaeon]
VAFLCVFAGMAFAYGGIPDIKSLIAVGLLFWYISNIAQVVNEYFDIEIDKIARPYAPIPSGQISREEAKKDTILHYIVALPLIILIVNALPVERIPLMIIAFWGVVVTAIYSVPPIRTRERGVLKNITVTFSPITSFLGGWVSIKGWYINTEAILLITTWFFLYISLSLIGDIRDAAGEAEVRCKTLPVRIGIKNTFKISFFIGILSALLIFLPVVLNMLNRYYTILGLIAIFCILFILVRYYMVFDPKKGKFYQDKFFIGATLYTIAVIIGSV